MQIEIIDKQDLLSADAISKTHARLNDSFGKYGSDVMSIRITVQDVNGPRGGIDKECRMLVRLRKMKDVTVSATDESLSKVIPTAVNRANRSVGRMLARRMVRGHGDITRLVFES